MLYKIVAGVSDMKLQEELESAESAEKKAAAKESARYSQAAMCLSMKVE